MTRVFEIVTKLHTKNRFDIFNLFEKAVISLPENEKKQVTEKFAAAWFVNYKAQGNTESNFQVLSSVFSNGNLTLRIEVF